MAPHIGAAPAAVSVKLSLNRLAMTNALPIFQIKVRPSPEINGREVCLLEEDVDLVEFFAADHMGLDPTELLIEMPQSMAPKTVRAGDVSQNDSDSNSP
jgi:hypothetical protein